MLVVGLLRHLSGIRLQDRAMTGQLPRSSRSNSSMRIESMLEREKQTVAPMTKEMDMRSNELSHMSPVMVWSRDMVSLVCHNLLRIMLKSWRMHEVALPVLDEQRRIGAHRFRGERYSWRFSVLATG